MKEDFPAEWFPMSMIVIFLRGDSSLRSKFEAIWKRIRERLAKNSRGKKNPLRQRARFPGNCKVGDIPWESFRSPSTSIEQPSDWQPLVVAPWLPSETLKFNIKDIEAGKSIATLGLTFLFVIAKSIDFPLKFVRDPVFQIQTFKTEFL